MRVHFGLGNLDKVDQVEIHWPSGAKETLKFLAVDRIYTVIEGQGVTGAICSGKPCGHAN